MSTEKPTTVIDRHFPPGPESDGYGWNPLTNEWEKVPPLGTVVEHDHTDIPTASPVSDTEGHVDGGTVPDARMNLIDSVRGGVADAPPVQVVRHLLETTEVPSDNVAARGVTVKAGGQPTILLNANPNRTRALLKVLTGGGAVYMGPTSSLANALVGAATGARPGWLLAAADPIFESKSSAEISAITGTDCDVQIWEEYADHELGNY